MKKKIWVLTRACTEVFYTKPSTLENLSDAIKIGGSGIIFACSVPAERCACVRRCSLVRCFCAVEPRARRMRRDSVTRISTDSAAPARDRCGLTAPGGNGMVPGLNTRRELERGANTGHLPGSGLCIPGFWRSLSQQTTFVSKVRLN